MQIKPSEAEILQTLQEAVQQHEEYMRLADLSDYTEVTEVFEPRYSWDNPIGLVVTERSYAKLV